MYTEVWLSMVVTFDILSEVILMRQGDTQSKHCFDRCYNSTSTTNSSELKVHMGGLCSILFGVHWVLA